MKNNDKYVEAKKYLQKRYPKELSDKRWNTSDINDDWVTEMMTDFASQSKPQEIPEENRQKLFNHMSTEHGLTLLESEMNSLYSICIGHEEYVKYLNWLHSKPVDTKTVDAVEWISVKEKLWDRYQAVWATDGKTIDRICTGNIEGTLKIYSDITHWTPIIKPNLP